jgi:hypothetical protein
VEPELTEPELEEETPSETESETASETASEDNIITVSEVFDSAEDVTAEATADKNVVVSLGYRTLNWTGE